MSDTIQPPNLPLNPSTSIPTSFSSVSGQSQCVKSNRHNPMSAMTVSEMIRFSFQTTNNSGIPIWEIPTACVLFGVCVMMSIDPANFHNLPISTTTSHVWLISELEDGGTLTATNTLRLKYNVTATNRKYSLFFGDQGSDVTLCWSVYTQWTPESKTHYHFGVLLSNNTKKYTLIDANDQNRKKYTFEYCMVELRAKRVDGRIIQTIRFGLYRSKRKATSALDRWHFWIPRSGRPMPPSSNYIIRNRQVIIGHSQLSVETICNFFNKESKTTNMQFKGWSDIRLLNSERLLANSSHANITNCCFFAIRFLKLLLHNNEDNPVNAVIPTGWQIVDWTQNGLLYDHQKWQNVGKFLLVWMRGKAFANP